MLIAGSSSYFNLSDMELSNHSLSHSDQLVRLIQFVRASDSYALIHVCQTLSLSNSQQLGDLAEQVGVAA